MPHKKKKRHGKAEPHDHNYKSTATSDKNRLFHNVKGNNNGVKQTVNVSVSVQPDDDPISGCFKSMFKCFKS